MVLPLVLALACLPRALAEELAAPKLKQQAEELASPKLNRPATMGMPAAPTLPTVPAYSCLGVPSTWPEAQQSWCCENQQIGCPSTTTPESTTTEKATTTTPKPTTKLRTTTTTKVITTAEPTTTTKPVPTTTTTPAPTTTTNSCDSACNVNGVAGSCRDQIQQASLSDFLGSVNSCDLAQGFIVQQCPICGGCPPHEAGCGVIEPVTTPAPTTTIPKGDPCKAVCILGEQPATCTARIMWSKEHVFVGKPKACVQAHAMVLGQCAVCSQCTLEASTCEGPDEAASTEELFDCDQGATMEWSSAKAVWCCEHHTRGCDVAPQDQQVFFQKKVAEDGEAPGAEASTRRAAAAAFIGVAALGSAALLAARSSSMGRNTFRPPRARSIDGYVERFVAE